MRRTTRIAICIALAIAATLVVGTPAAEAQQLQWQVRTLNPLPGDTVTEVFDVNKGGYAVGRSDLTPVIWIGNDPTALPVPEGHDGIAYAINDWGLIVGTSGPQGGERDAAAWVFGTYVKVIDNGDAYDVNDQGDIVGCSGGTDADGRRPFIRRIGSDTIGSLPITTGYTAGCATTINAWGGIGGFDAANPVPGPRVFDGQLWYQGTRVAAQPNTVQRVVDVTSSGYAIGQLERGESDHPAGHSVVMLPGGSFGVLEPLAAGSQAAAMTDFGVAVGRRHPTASTQEAVLWVYGSTVPLSTLVTTQASMVGTSRPVAVSESLMIAGNQADGARGYVLMPIHGLPSTGAAPNPA